MKVYLEHTRAACDHCGKIGNVIILTSEFNGKVDGSIQLCNEHAVFFAKEILKSNGIDPTESPSEAAADKAL